MWKMDSVSGCDIRLVFTLPPRDSTLQYKRCVQLWNNFPYITPLTVHINAGNTVHNTHVTHIQVIKYTEQGTRMVIQYTYTQDIMYTQYTYTGYTVHTVNIYLGFTQ